MARSTGASRETSESARFDAAPSSTLLLGLGNPILGDDAVGILLARELGSRLLGIPSLEVIEDCSVGGLDLLEVIGGRDRLVILDSIRTAGGVPGNWYRFTATALRETLHLQTVHDANFATVLTLGRRMGVPLPSDEEIHVFAVEIQPSTTFHEGLTPALDRAFPEIVEEIHREVAELIRRQPGAPPA